MSKNDSVQIYLGSMDSINALAPAIASCICAMRLAVLKGQDAMSLYAKK